MQQSYTFPPLLDIRTRSSRAFEGAGRATLRCRSVRVRKSAYTTAHYLRFKRVLYTIRNSHSLSLTLSAHSVGNKVTPYSYINPRRAAIIEFSSPACLKYIYLDDSKSLFFHLFSDV